VTPPDGGDSTDSGDGNSSEFVLIGKIKWMAKNLNKDTVDSWCYENSPDSCAKYGRLYTWGAAKAACLSVGMRLPTYDEWRALVMAAEGEGIAGKILKSKRGWNNRSDGSSGNGIDNFDFSALPGGIRYSDGNFGNVGISGVWWTATEIYVNFAYGTGMGYYYNYVNNGYYYKYYGRSVRCVTEHS
jgi:uncharacterized protein (TIGR02145 family)